MKDYYAPDWWYEPDDDREAPDCDECKERDQKIDQIGDYFNDLQKMLYSKDELDVKALKDIIHDMCWYMDIKPVQGELTITRKKETKILHADFIDKLFKKQKFLQVQVTI